ncbi:MAG: DMT family transporter [Burkholderiaceae bacterium]|nr:DMT family transporter [Burkholderiaceae bacterium]
MDSRKSLDPTSIGLMVVLCLIWGLTQVVLKMAAADVTPLMQIALRSGVAAVLVTLLMVARKERLELAGGTWKPGLLVGVLFALEFLLVGEGLRFTTASHMAVFLYTAPIFAALGLHWLMPSERLGMIQWAGIGLAFSGIAITFLMRSGVGPEINTADMLFGDLLAVAAGMVWGATTVAVRCSRLARVSAAQTLLYQLAVAFVLLVIATILLDQTTIRWTAIAWTSMIFQSVVVCFASYLAWFWLLRHYMASQLGVFSFLTPLFGVAFGVWLLNEPLELSFMVGAVLVLTGIVMVSGYGWIKAQITRK